MMLLQTQRFLMRPLLVADVGERYLSWFQERAVSSVIESAGSMRNLEVLRRYVGERQDRDDVRFLGIFHAATGEHIGNIKFEPYLPEKKYAVLGILIGPPEWRGKGVGREVIEACHRWLASQGIERIYLGVKKSNESARTLYLKLGYRPDPDNFLGIDRSTVDCMVYESAVR